MKREIIFNPAYDYVNDPDPKKRNYGRHCVDMYWSLKGELGCVTWMVCTSWNLPETNEAFKKSDYCPRPLPADLSVHSPKKLRGGWDIHNKECHWIDGKPCYCITSGIKAEPVFEKLVREGHEAAWTELENLYIRTFRKLK